MTLVDVLVNLGALATKATEGGDDRAAVSLREAIELVVAGQAAVARLAELQLALQREEDDRLAAEDERLEARRESARIRQTRHRRHAMSRDVTDGHAMSRDVTDGHAMSRDVTRDPLPHGPSLGLLSPSPSTNSTTTQHRAGAREADGEASETGERITTLLTARLGPLWPDVEAFLRRRSSETWTGWMKEMLVLLTSGRAIPEDVAQACRDDAALARPIGSPKALRAFVANAVEDRVHPKQPDNNQSRPAQGAVGIGGRAYLTTLDAIKDL